jgi:hypothetical protein
VKINEIIAEGIGDWVASKIPGTQSRINAQTDKIIQQNTKPWIDRWNQIARANPKSNNPYGLQKYAQNLAMDNGKILFTVDAPTDMTPKGINAYLSNIVGQVVYSAPDNEPTSNTTAQSNTVVPTTSTPDGTQTTPSGIVIPPTYSKPRDYPVMDNPGQQAIDSGPALKRGTIALDPKHVGPEVTDHNGETWTKSPTDQFWRNENGGVVMDPSAKQNLEAELSKQQGNQE